MNDTKKGRLITFEGLEGSGKSTNSEYVFQYLKDRDIPAVLTREPGGTEIGQKIRAILLSENEVPIDALTELLLMFASRAQLLRTKIEPAISRGEWVICDRYVDSSFAYQGGGRELGQDLVEKAFEVLDGVFVNPDLTFFLDIDPERIESRLRERNLNLTTAVASGQRASSIQGATQLIPDRFEREDLEFFCRIRQAYIERMKVVPMQMIDANQPLATVKNEIEQVLFKFVKKELSR